MKVSTKTKASLKRRVALMMAFIMTLSCIPAGWLLLSAETSVGVEVEWNIYPTRDPSVQQLGTNDHLMELGLNLDNDGIAAILDDGGATLDFDFRVAHNTGRRVLVWTDLSENLEGATADVTCTCGDCTASVVTEVDVELDDITFATAANISGGQVVVSAALPSGTDALELTIPAELLYDEVTNTAATVVYVAMAINAGNTGTDSNGFNRYAKATHHRGNTSRNNVNSVNLTAEFNLFYSLTLSAGEIGNGPGNGGDLDLLWCLSDQADIADIPFGGPPAQAGRFITRSGDLAANLTDGVLTMTGRNNTPSNGFFFWFNELGFPVDLEENQYTITIAGRLEDPLGVAAIGSFRVYGRNPNVSQITPDTPIDANGEFSVVFTIPTTAPAWDGDHLRLATSGAGSGLMDLIIDTLTIEGIAENGNDNDNGNDFLSWPIANHPAPNQPVVGTRYEIIRSGAPEFADHQQNQMLILDIHPSVAADLIDSNGGTLSATFREVAGFTSNNRQFTVWTDVSGEAELAFGATDPGVVRSRQLTAPDNAGGVIDVAIPRSMLVSEGGVAATQIFVSFHTNGDASLRGAAAAGTRGEEFSRFAQVELILSGEAPLEGVLFCLQAYLEAQDYPAGHTFDQGPHPIARSHPAAEVSVTVRGDSYGERYLDVVRYIANDTRGVDANFAFQVGDIVRAEGRVADPVGDPLASVRFQLSNNAVPGDAIVNAADFDGDGYFVIEWEVSDFPNEGGDPFLGAASQRIRINSTGGGDPRPAFHITEWTIYRPAFVEPGLIVHEENPDMDGPFVVSNPYADIDWDTTYQFRAALHAHTIRSDGHEPVQNVVLDHYNKGFDILAIADHNILAGAGWVAMPPSGFPRGHDWWATYPWWHANAGSGGTAQGGRWGPWRWQDRMIGIAGEYTAEELQDAIRAGTFTGPFRTLDGFNDYLFGDRNIPTGTTPWFSFNSNGPNAFAPAGEFRRPDVRGYLEMPPAQAGRGMINIPFTNEHTFNVSGADDDDHMNVFFADFNLRPASQDPGRDGNDNRGIFRRAYEYGGIVMLNHPGRHTRSTRSASARTNILRPAPGTSTRGADGGAGGIAASNNIHEVDTYVFWAETYPSIISMEIINRLDNESRSDRVLWDNILLELMPQGRNFWGFATDDSHHTNQTGHSWTVMLMDDLNAGDTRTAMETGASYAVTRVARLEGLRPGAPNGGSGTAQATWFEETVPVITDIVVDETAQTITIEADNAGTIQWITGNPFRAQGDATQGGGVVIYEGATLCLDTYGQYIWGNYVRAVLKSPGYYDGYGAVAFTQPFGVFNQADGVPTFTFDALPTLASNNFRDVFANVDDRVTAPPVRIPEGASLEEVLRRMPSTVWVETERGWGYPVPVTWDFTEEQLNTFRAGDVGQTMTLTGTFPLPVSPEDFGPGAVHEVTNTGNVPLTINLPFIIAAAAEDPTSVDGDLIQSVELVFYVEGVTAADPAAGFTLDVWGQSWAGGHTGTAILPAVNGWQNATVVNFAGTDGLIRPGGVGEVAGSTATLTTNRIIVNGITLYFEDAFTNEEGNIVLQPGVPGDVPERRLPERWSQLNGVNIPDGTVIATSADGQARLVMSRYIGYAGQDGLQGLVTLVTTELCCDCCPDTSLCWCSACDGGAETLTYSWGPYDGAPLHSTTSGRALYVGYIDEIGTGGDRGQLLRFDNIGLEAAPTGNSTLTFTLDGTASGRTSNNRYLMVWTNLSGDGTEYISFITAFATAAEAAAGNIVHSAQVMPNASSAQVTLPRHLLVCAETGTLATTIYVIPRLRGGTAFNEDSFRFDVTNEITAASLAVPSALSCYCHEPVLTALTVADLTLTEAQTAVATTSAAVIAILDEIAAIVYEIDNNTNPSLGDGMVITWSFVGDVFSTSPGAINMFEWTATLPNGLNVADGVSLSGTIGVRNHDPDAPTFALTVNAAGNGSVSPEGGIFAEGVPVSITAIAGAGYVFTGWSGDVLATGNASPLNFNMPARDVTITATFTPEQEETFALTVTAVGGGSVSPNSGSFAEGAAVSITATPNQGYIFAGWSGDVLATGNASPLNFNMPARDVTITATFTPDTDGIDVGDLTGNGRISIMDVALLRTYVMLMGHTLTQSVIDRIDEGAGNISGNATPGIADVAYLRTYVMGMGHTLHLDIQTRLAWHTASN